MTARDPLNAGLSRRYFDGHGFINDQTWRAAIAGRHVVGTCRRQSCGGVLRALPTEEVGKRTWFTASCHDCGHEVTSPDGRTLPRSSRREEMPGGAWDNRERLLGKLKELARPQEGEDY